MESKTAIQQAIEEIKVFRKKASFEYKAARTNEDKEEWLSSISAIDGCLDLLRNYLTKEQEVIQYAYHDGLNASERLIIPTPEEYFIHTYGQTNT